MTNTNFFVEVGNVTRDIQENDFGYTQNGSARLNFSIAVNRSKKQGDQWIDEVSYLNFTCWGSVAENMKKFLHKGSKVCVTGFIKQERWTDKDGKNQSRLSLVAEQVELCGGNSGNTQNQEVTQNKPTFQAVNQQQNYQNVNNGIQEDYPYPDPDSSDIPF